MTEVANHTFQFFTKDNGSSTGFEFTPPSSPSKFKSVTTDLPLNEPTPSPTKSTPLYSGVPKRTPPFQSPQPVNPPSPVIFKVPLPIIKKDRANGSASITPKRSVKAFLQSATPQGTPQSPSRVQPTKLFDDQSKKDTPKTLIRKFMNNESDWTPGNQEQSSNDVQDLSNVAKQLQQREEENKQLELKLNELIDVHTKQNLEQQAVKSELINLLEETKKEREQVERAMNSIRQYETETNTVDTEILELQRRVQTLQRELQEKMEASNKDDQQWNSASLLLLFLFTLFSVFGLLLILNSLFSANPLMPGDHTMHQVKSYPREITEDNYGAENYTVAERLFHFLFPTISHTSPNWRILTMRPT